MAEITRTRIRELRSDRPRSMSTRQWGALIGGGALALYGISRRSAFGAALAAGGGALAIVGANQKTSRTPSTSTSILVTCTPQECYRFWHDFENLPRFMKRLRSVNVFDNRRSSWSAIGPMGKTVDWDTEITDERENEYIAWRSLPGSDIRVDGRVEFRPAPADRGTLIKADLKFAPSMGQSSSISKFFSKGANFALRQDLRRLEALMEAGEIPTTEGQPHGPRDFVTGVMRLADPTRPIPSKFGLRRVFEERRRTA